MVSMDDVAVYAKVSKATVSRVFNGNAKVSSETRNRVLAACNTLNYKLNSSIQDLAKKGRSGYTYNIAFVLVDRDFSDPAYTDLLDHIVQEVNERHLHLMLVKLPYQVDSVYDLPPVLRDERVDGILMTGDLNTNITGVIEQLGIPAMILGKYDSSICRNICCIHGNLEKNISNAIDEAFLVGVRRLAFASEDRNHYFWQMVLTLYRDGLQRNNCTFQEELCYWGNGPCSGVYDVMLPVFRKKQLPFDAVLALDVRIAREISHLSARHCGFSDTFSPIIITNFRNETWHEPVININKNSGEKQITMTFDMLEKLFQGENIPREIIL